MNNLLLVTQFLISDLAYPQSKRPCVPVGMFKPQGYLHQAGIYWRERERERDIYIYIYDSAPAGHLSMVQHEWPCLFLQFSFRSRSILMTLSDI